LQVFKASVGQDLGVVTPPDLKMIVSEILERKPSIVFMPHVETSVGVILHDNYISEIAEACRKVGGLLCVDGIAAGTLWADMKKLGIDVYITAPQKGWSSPASCGIVLLGDRALEVLYDKTQP
jgi:aspartate aminotransferase-like enzyme